MNKYNATIFLIVGIIFGRILYNEILSLLAENGLTILDILKSPWFLPIIIPIIFIIFGVVVIKKINNDI